MPPRLFTGAVLSACLLLTGPPALPQTPAAPVDINHATVAQLLQVPGITRVWAGRIIRFRPYRAKNDLLEKGILPSAVYDRARNALVAHRQP